MKISEMTNDQACDAILRISGPFARITEDPEAAEILNMVDEMSSGKVSAAKAMPKLLPRFAAFGLKAHREDFYEVVGALTGASLEAVRKMNFIATIGVLRESWDEVAAGFFPSSGKQPNVTTEE